MKKSTLITTIAMIVVVVVALSTATYAWFSSQATAVASTNFTTSSSGEWSMILGTVSGNSVTFNSAAVDSIDLPSSAIATGLWTPTAKINTTIADTNASTTLSNKANFVSALKTTASNGDPLYQISALQTPVVNGTTAVANTGVVAPYALRILNVSGSDGKQLQLNITLNAGSTTTNNTLYAAAALRFYIFEIQSGTTPTTNTYSSGYNHAVASTGVSPDTLDTMTTISTTTGEGTDAVTTYKYITKSAAGDSQTNNLTSNSTAVDLINYSVGDIRTGIFEAAQADDPALGISKNDLVHTYTFDLGTYNAGQFSNIIIYAWIDGWTADASASQANFNVNFGFNTRGND